MKTQWYLCEIENYPENAAINLKTTDNLSAFHPDVFEENDSWLVWLPIIPRVGDTLQFGGWQLQVSRVTLLPNWKSKTGIQNDMIISARVSIRKDSVPTIMNFPCSVDLSQKDKNWETFAYRGNDLQYFAWELRHDSFVIPDNEAPESKRTFYRWHTRIRPVVGDKILVSEHRWEVTSVELSSANESIDGYLSLVLAD